MHPETYKNYVLQIYHTHFSAYTIRLSNSDRHSIIHALKNPRKKTIYILYPFLAASHRKPETGFHSSAPQDIFAEIHIASPSPLSDLFRLQLERCRRTVVGEMREREREKRNAACSLRSTHSTRAITVTFRGLLALHARGFAYGALTYIKALASLSPSLRGVRSSHS